MIIIIQKKKKSITSKTKKQKHLTRRWPSVDKHKSLDAYIEGSDNLGGKIFIHLYNIEMGGLYYSDGKILSVLRVRKRTG